MKTVFISDTHGLHHQLAGLPEGDLIIHGGDMTRRGTPEEVEDFLNWFINLPYRHKIFIAGNHDFYFEHFTRQQIQNDLPEDCHYLLNSGVNIEGIKIWGSPVTPTFFNWAFNEDRGAPIKKFWDMIPTDTDVLITHGPPGGILDETVSGQQVGCSNLSETVNFIRPKFHLFGHIHEAYGSTISGATTFINGSILNEKYEAVNPPHEFLLSS